MKRIILFSILLFSVSIAMSQISIGGVNWASDNLSIIKYNDGTPIRLAKTLDEWDDAAKKKEGAYFIKVINGKKYFYYNYHAIRNKKGIIPKGFHFPNSDDFEKLISEFIKDGDKAVKKFNLIPTGFINKDSESGFYITSDEGFGFWILWDKEGDKDEDYYLNSDMGNCAYFSYDIKCLDKFPFPCSTNSEKDRESLKYSSSTSGGTNANFGLSIRLIKNTN
jgi:uncharacterized protein (TIGR02145 family)